MNSTAANSNKKLVLLAASLITFICCTDFSIVFTIIPAIQRDLGANMNQSQWLMVGFTLTAAAFFITLGRFADLIGHRKLLFLGVIGFAVSSLLAGLARSPSLLVTMRLLQGIFVAAALPASMAIISDTFPIKERGRALGIFNSATGIGLAAGPTIGSLVIYYLTWRWVFFLNIPIAAIALVVGLVSIKESKISKVAVDWLGTVLLTITIGAILYVISQVSYYGWHGLVMWALLIFFVSLILLVIVECKVKQQVIPFKLFLNKGFILGAMLFSATVGFAWSVMMIMPIYLHKQLGFSIEASGLLIFVMTLMTIIAPIVAGHWFDKKNKVVAMHVTFLLSFLGLLLFAMLQSYGPMWLLIAGFIIFGFAWGAGNGISIPFALAEAGADENAGVIGGGLVCTLYIVAVFTLTIFMAIFHHSSANLPFAMRMHHGFYFLMVCLLFFWLFSTVKASATVSK
ncbi:MAG: MFS transporter [Pseudomonadota bacterium]